MTEIDLIILFRRQDANERAVCRNRWAFLRRPRKLNDVVDGRLINDRQPLTVATLDGAKFGRSSQRIRFCRAKSIKRSRRSRRAISGQIKASLIQQRVAHRGKLRFFTPVDKLRIKTSNPLTRNAITRPEPTRKATTVQKIGVHGGISTRSTRSKPTLSSTILWFPKRPQPHQRPGHEAGQECNGRIVKPRQYPLEQTGEQ